MANMKVEITAFKNHKASLKTIIPIMDKMNKELRLSPLTTVANATPNNMKLRHIKGSNNHGNRKVAFQTAMVKLNKVKAKTRTHPRRN